jgi:hypothetical protein
MPNPIQASIDPALCSLSDGVSAEEYDAQMCLSPLAPLANGAQTAAPASSAPSGSPPSPAVSALVSRFTTPTGAHPPVEPSLTEALLNCKVATTAYLANTAGVVIAAPETLGASFVFGALRIAATSAALISCIDQNEAKQVQDGNRANQAADCRNEGAIPLTTADGLVVCEKQP